MSDGHSGAGSSPHCMEMTTLVRLTISTTTQGYSQDWRWHTLTSKPSGTCCRKWRDCTCEKIQNLLGAGRSQDVPRSCSEEPVMMVNQRPEAVNHKADGTKKSLQWDTVRSPLCPGRTKRGRRDGGTGGAVLFIFSFLFVCLLVFFWICLIFQNFVLGVLHGWREDVESLGGETNWDICCEITNDSLKKLC